MNRGLSEAIARDDEPDAPVRSSPTIAVITLRFVLLLTAIVGVFAWAWSR